MVTPANAFDNAVGWTSDNAQVADVDRGKVTLKQTGMANITMTSKSNNSIFDQVKILAVDPKIQGAARIEDDKPESYTVDLKAVEVPDYVEQDFIRKNIFSRPDVGRQKVDKIVIHYVANPGSTARNNRDYFDSLADQDPQKSGSSASSHFVVGLEGEVIQCIPVNEIAYANAPLNNTTVAIEVCHPDDSGKFNDATYESLVDLTAFLCRQLKLTPGDVIRHYDVNEKLCPKYYVEHKDAWEQFLKDVKAAMKTESAG